MELTVVVAGASLLIGSVILSVGVERLIRRLGVTPEDPHDRARGFRDVLTRLEAWGRGKTSRRDQS